MSEWQHPKDAKAARSTNDSDAFVVKMTTNQSDAFVVMLARGFRPGATPTGPHRTESGSPGGSQVGIRSSAHATACATPLSPVGAPTPDPPVMGCAPDSVQDPMHYRRRGDDN